MKYYSLLFSTLFCVFNYYIIISFSDYSCSLDSLMNSQYLSLSTLLYNFICLYRKKSELNFIHFCMHNLFIKLSGYCQPRQRKTYISSVYKDFCRVTQEDYTFSQPFLFFITWLDLDLEVERYRQRLIGLDLIRADSLLKLSSTRFIFILSKFKSNNLTCF